MTLRTTIYLEESVVTRIRRFIPARGFSQFINELLQKSIAELEKAEIEEQMRQGYLATRQDRTQLNQDWQQVDSEGWPT